MPDAILTVEDDLEFLKVIPRSSEENIQGISISSLDACVGMLLEACLKDYESFDAVRREGEQYHLASPYRNMSTAYKRARIVTFCVVVIS